MTAKFKAAESAIRNLLEAGAAPIPIPRIVQSAKQTVSEDDVRAAVWDMIDTGILRVDQQYGVALNENSERKE